MPWPEELCPGTFVTLGDRIVSKNPMLFSESYTGIDLLMVRAYI